MKKIKKEGDSFWSDGYFAQTTSPEEMKKISAHNKDWHDGMCDGCFNEAYFPEEQRADEESRKRA